MLREITALEFGCGFHYFDAMKRRGLPPWKSWGCAAGLAWTTFAGACLGDGEERMWLGEADPLFQSDKYFDNGYALRAITPIKDLPKRIAFKPGEISLIVDPTDRRRDYFVVYLVNDTDQAIPRIIGELNKVHSQVRFGGNWFSREPMKAVCGTVPEPRDLPPRHALALGAIRDDLGDIGGDIRYVFHIPGSRIMSEPRRGRYFQANLRSVMVDQSPGVSLAQFFEKGGNKWPESDGTGSLEEFCVTLELIRNYRLDLKGRSKLLEWIIERTAKHDATPEQVVAIKTMKAVLSRPWVVENDAQSLADRCIAAFERKPSRIYGSPEKCKSFVWRFLAGQGLGGGMIFAGQDSKAADGQSVARLAELAKAALTSGDEELADAAAAFLANTSREDLFPSEEFMRFIESGRPDRIRSGINGLSRRGKAQDVGPWLLDKAIKGEAEARFYFTMIRSRMRGPEQDWEKRVVKHLFEQNALETLRLLSCYPRSESVHKLPTDCDAILRAFLQDQLSEKGKLRWKNLAERDKLGQLKPEEEGYCQALSHGIRLIDSWNDPADTPILQAFLDHPAANLNACSDGSGTLFYTARDTAKSCLVRRKVQIPISLVTKIDIPKPPPPRDWIGDFEQFMCRNETLIVGTGTAVLLVSGLISWRFRRKATALAQGD